MKYLIFALQSGRGGAWRDAMMESDEVSSGTRTVGLIIFIIFAILLYSNKGKKDANN